MSTLRKAPGASEERRQKDRSSWKYDHHHDYHADADVYDDHHDFDDDVYDEKSSGKHHLDPVGGIQRQRQIPVLAGASERMPPVGSMGWDCVKASTPSGSACSGTDEMALR